MRGLVGAVKQAVSDKFFFFIWLPDETRGPNIFFLLRYIMFCYANPNLYDVLSLCNIACCVVSRWFPSSNLKRLLSDVRRWSVGGGGLNARYATLK